MDPVSVFDATSQLVNETIRSMAGIMWVLIPLAGIAWLLLVGLSEEKTKRQRQELLHRERMAALEKGMTEALEHAIEADAPPRPRNPHGLLVGGIITLGVGLGMVLFMGFALSGSNRNQGIAVGLIPLCVGIALIVAWVVVRRLNGHVEERAPRNG